MTGIALDTKDAKAARDELDSRGVELDGEMMGGDGTVPLVFSIKDQDGNSLMIVEAGLRRRSPRGAARCERRPGSSPASDNGVDDLGPFGLGGCAVDVDEEVDVAVVRGLELGPGLDVDDPADRHVDSLGRLAEVHRQGPLDDDERLLLRRLPVTPAPGARLVAPEVGAGVPEPGELAVLGDVARRLPGLVRPGDPVELLGLDDAESHAAHCTSPGLSSTAWRSTRSAAISRGSAAGGSASARGRRLFLGAAATAMIAFPEPDADLAGAVSLAVDRGVREVGCWALRARRGARDRGLHALGFQDGWAPHWMGIDPDRTAEPPARARSRRQTECADGLPYGVGGTRGYRGRRRPPLRRARGRERSSGTPFSTSTGDQGGIYDMGVAPHARRRGHARALTLAALGRAREAGCTGVTLNATGEGEPVYRSVGFESLGWGMTWWLFPRC